MDPILLPDHASYVLPFIIIDHDTGIPCIIAQTGPLHLIFIHDDKTISSFVSAHGQEFFSLFINQGDAWHTLIHSQTDTGSSLSI